MEIQSTVNKLETGSFSGIPTPSRNVSCLGSLHPLTVTHCSDRAACGDRPAAARLGQTAGRMPELLFLCRRAWSAVPGSLP